MIMVKKKPVSKTLDDLERKYSTPTERITNKIVVQYVVMIIDEMEKRNLTERQLADISGVSAKTIHRMRMLDNVKFESIIKVLYALGKKLAVVPLEDGDIY